jgi:flagellar basal body rod protein FlgB
MYEKNPQRVLKGLPPEQIAFLNTEVNQDFIIDVDKDWAEPNGLTENNVNIEREMMDEAKNGMQYQVIAGLLSKSYAQMNTIIKGQNQ